MTDDTTIEHIFNRARDGWIAVIECTECGYRGPMHSTHEPREETVWTCQRCETEAIHRTIMSANVSEEVGR